MKKTLRISFSLCFVLLLSFSVQAQQLKVSGVVRDTSGNGVPAVTITIKGQASAKALTDSKGLYSINVPNNKSVLVFTSVGFMPTEKKVGDHTNIDVSLTPGTGNV